MDLLDRIFQLNESKRIKIPEIRQHPWFTAPMSPKYAGPMEAINKEQEGLVHLMEKSKVRICLLVCPNTAACYGRLCQQFLLVDRPGKVLIADVAMAFRPVAASNSKAEEGGIGVRSTRIR